MSVFYCDHCDQLVDSDELPEFEYDEKTLFWKCQICIENEEELNLLKEKYQEMSSNPEFVGLLQDWNYNYEGKEN